MITLTTTLLFTLNAFFSFPLSVVLIWVWSINSISSFLLAGGSPCRCSVWPLWMLNVGHLQCTLLSARWYLGLRSSAWIRTDKRKQTHTNTLRSLTLSSTLMQICVFLWNAHKLSRKITSNGLRFTPWCSATYFCAHAQDKTGVYFVIK